MINLTTFNFRLILVLLLLLLLSINGIAQVKNVHCVPVKQPPLIDGVLLPGEWMLPDSATGFTQMEPQKGSPATCKTTVYVCQDNRAVYFAFKCYQPDPQSIVAKIRTRDELSKKDDAVVVLLDTYMDQRTAFGFLVNGLSTQTDFRVADDGRQIETNWDAEWEAAARRTAWGWSAEFAIPFSSIHYNNNLDSWTVNFGRVIRSNSETVYWSGELNDDFRVSQGGLLSGLQLPGKNEALKITPYSTLRFEDSDETGRHGDWLGDGGVDLSYQLTTAINSSFTINPDFATVEGDQEKINLSRWELDFPEKRLFFLEGSEHFSTRIRTFYSRRIGDIDYGGKLNGKYSDYTFALIGTHSAENPETGEPAANFSVLRLKKDVLASSTIGMMLVDKSWRNGYTRSFSADYVLNLGKAWKLTGQWVGSAPGDLLSHSAWFVRAARESNIYHYHVRYSHLGENFQENVNQTGFIREDDMREIDADVTYRLWMSNPAIKYIHLKSRNNVYWNQKGTLRSWYVTQSAKMYLQNRFSVDFSYNDEFKLYEKKFYNHKYEIELGYNTDEWAHAELGYEWGRNFDRDFGLLSARIRFRPIPQLALSYSLKSLHFAPDTSHESTSINVLSLDYNFTRDLWVRVLAQNHTAKDRFYLYGLFGYRFKPPFGALYLIYTSDHQDVPDLAYREKNNILFLKLSYQIRR